MCLIKLICVIIFCLFTVEGQKLIPRKTLLEGPEKRLINLSPDGKYVSYLAPLNGVPNIWIQPIDGKARAVTNDEGKPIIFYSWTLTEDVLTYVQDSGRGLFKSYLLNITGTKPISTPVRARDGSRIDFIAASPKFPQFSIIAVNDRDPRFPDLYRLDVRTGAKTRILINTGFVGFIFDNDLKLRSVSNESPHGGVDHVLPVEDQNGAIIQWKPYRSVKMDDFYGTRFVGFSKNNKKAYWFESAGKNFNALYETDFDNPKKKRLIYQAKNSDLDQLWQHPTEFTPLAVLANYDYPEYHILDQSIKPDIDYLKTLEPEGRPIVSSTSTDFNKWLILWMRSDKPMKHYIYDRSQKKATPLFDSQEMLRKQKLAQMHPIEIKTRDDFTQLCYLTVPVEHAAQESFTTKPISTVLLVHGGPWARDVWGFNVPVQLFANRGYAVLQCNFRGSVGLGKHWLKAANAEWGGKMHTDLLDAVKWAIDAKVADSKKIAIIGADYGGYAALVGLSFTPDKFACGVNEMGPSNLETFVRHLPPFFQTRIGADLRFPRGVQFLKDRSPYNKAYQIKRPLLIGQGANDRIVNRFETDQLVRAITNHNNKVTYVVFPDEGHRLARPQNRLLFLAITEKFLANCLGGKAEPIEAVMRESSAQILEKGNI